MGSGGFEPPCGIPALQAGEVGQAAPTALERGKKIQWSGRDDLTTEGRTGFEPVSNGFTDRFLSHLDHVPVDQAGLEPTTPGL